MPLLRLFDDMQPGEKQRALWTARDNKLLLDLIAKSGKVLDLCVRGSFECDSVYEELSRQLSERGCLRTKTQVRGKWTNMKTHFIKEMRRRDSGETKGPAHLSAELFDGINKILGENVRLLRVNKHYRIVPSSIEDVETASREVTQPQTDFYPLEVCLTVMGEDGKKDSSNRYASRVDPAKNSLLSRLLSQDAPPAGSSGATCIRSCEVEGLTQGDTTAAAEHHFAAWPSSHLERNQSSSNLNHGSEIDVIDLANSKAVSMIEWNVERLNYEDFL